MNPYDILKLPQNASNREIIVAYRKLALKYHPDQNDSEDAKLKFLEINEAYKTLLNAEAQSPKRQKSESSNFKTWNWLGSFWSKIKSIFKEEDTNLNIYSEILIEPNEARAGITKEFEFEVIDFNDFGEEVISTKKFKITIPQNTEPGSYIRLQGLGLPSVEANYTGDLLLEVKYFGA